MSHGAEGAALGGSFVTSLAVSDDGSVFAGGLFQVAGHVHSPGVARWDGEEWHAMGAGLGRPAYALAAGPGGVLYVGGHFASAGGVPARHIARWDGATWHAMGDGFEHYVDALAVASDGSVYAGGNSWMLIGDYPIKVGHISRWDGAGWSQVGDTLTYGVHAIEVAVDGSLYVGGGFGLRRWSGTAWVHAGVEGNVVDLTRSPDGDLVVGGWGLYSGDWVGETGVARFDGESWQAIGGVGQRVDQINAVAADSSGAIYAGGSLGGGFNRIARWDGTAWQQMAGGVTEATWGPGPQPIVWALAADDEGVLHVGGGFDRAGGIASPRLARWVDGAWQSAGGGINDDVRAIAFDENGRTVIGGQMGIAGGRAVNHVALGDSTGWSRMDGGLYEAVLALAYDRAGRLLACGGGVHRWDGAAWTQTPSGPSVSGNCYSLVTSPTGDVYFGGTWNIGLSRVARWDGLAWTSLGSPGAAYALAFDSGGAPLAGGSHGVSRWDGTAWHSLGLSAGGAVWALAVAPDGSVYAGGDFASIGGVPAAYVARWDGTAWAPVGNGVNGRVQTLVIDGAGGVYAGGSFTFSGVVSAGYLARWDGLEWAEVGGGTDGPVYTLTFDAGGDLWVGGRFGSAGGIGSPYLALWETGTTRAVPAPPPAAVSAGPVWPNPVKESAQLPVTLREPGAVRLLAYDAIGREVAVLWEGVLPAGRNEIRIDGARLAAGIYAVRVTGAGTMATVRMVVR